MPCLLCDKNGLLHHSFFFLSDKLDAEGAETNKERHNESGALDIWMNSMFMHLSPETRAFFLVCIFYFALQFVLSRT